MKRTLKRRSQPSGDVALQITSLADVFVILLVFLLKGYASGAIQVQPSAGMRLPASVASEKSSEGIKLEISENGVSLESKFVMGLDHFKVNNADLTKLNAVFDVEKRKQEETAKINPNLKTSGSHLILIADEHTPIETLQTIMGVAASYGFTDLQFAVIQDEEGKS